VIAIITGSAQGIGAATAGRLSRAGFDLMLVDLNPAVKEVASALAKGGRQVAFYEADLGIRGFGQPLIEATMREFGRVDVVVNNVGVGHHYPFLETTTERLETSLAVNFEAAYELCLAAIPQMLRQGDGGSIVNIASLAGLLGFKKLSAYGASKGAVIALTRSLAVEFGPQGIRCNAVAPGPTQTPALRALSPETLANRLARIPLGRLGEPEDVAEAVLFFASSASRYVTGQVLSVDGGTTAYGS
jgi:NAD(P)-dependent dehydrogenase (short-subunit alcohol dehydrogenase family)